MEGENVLEGRTGASMSGRFQNSIIGKIGSYDLTEEQVSLFRKRNRDGDNLEEVEVSSQKKGKDREEEMMETGEKDEEGNNLAMGMFETEID